MLKNTQHQNLSITDPLHPTLELQISNGEQKQNRKVPALIDTGFDGYISLPKSLASELNLEIIGETDVEVATGDNFVVQICVCRFSIIGLEIKTIEAEAIISNEGELLIGTKYLDLFFNKFGIDFQEKILHFDLK
jgi:clan AA aspartic protease